MSVKKYIPKSLRNAIHFLYGWMGSVRYHHPSEELLVIGITGTSGKSSCVHFLRQLLTFAGYKVGSLSTVDFSIAGRTTLNDKKMTMLGRMAIQAYLREMVTAGCQVAIVEMTSEGAVQYRHRFINIDTMVLTNFYPEHIESHGSFEAYKAAKLSLFDHVAGSKRKKAAQLHVGPMSDTGVIPKTAIVNGNNEYASEFINFPFDASIAFGRSEQKKTVPPGPDDVYASLGRYDETGTHFTVGTEEFVTPIHGEHTVTNLTAVMAAAHTLGISWGTIGSALSEMQGTPGRIEFIPEAAAKGVQVIVDYAFEPVAIAELYKVVERLPHERIIHVFGSTGGGRDVSRRATVGAFVGAHADVCIVTDEDPYDDDPLQIMQDVARAVASVGKQLGEDYMVIPDRRAAIAHAWQLAEKGDIILITGKGSEQKIVRANGQMVDWDDRRVVREVIKIASSK